MKCEFCGGNLSLEDLNCPHCGKENKQARQHIRDMQRYHGEFEKTKKEIYAVGRSYSQITVRAIIIVVLVIALIITAVLYSEAYSIMRKWKNRDAKVHMAEYMEQIDSYIEEEDFLALNSFFSEHPLDFYGINKEYAVYRPVIWTAQYYINIYYQVVDLADLDEEYRERRLKYLGDSIEGFYNYSDRAKYDNNNYYSYSDNYWNYSEEKCGKALDTMEVYVEKLLQTYCNLTQEEAAGLRELSNAKRMVLIEERMADVE